MSEFLESKSLDELVLIRYSHVYNGSDGQSNHLKVLNRTLLERNSMVIYQIYPGLDGGDLNLPTADQPLNLKICPLLTTVHGTSRSKFSRIKRSRFEIKRALRMLYPKADRLTGELRRIFFEPAWISTGRFMPFLSHEVRMVQEATQKLDLLLGQIRRAHENQSIIFMDHSPCEPYSWMRIDLARKHGLVVALQHHGGFSATSSKILSRVSKSAWSSGVTLAGCREALGSSPARLGNGIDLAFFDPSSVTVGSFRSGSAIPEEVPLILVPARVTVAKGHSTLVDAMKLLAGRGVLQGATVVFAGQEDQPFTRYLQDEIERSYVLRSMRFLFVGGLDPVKLRAAYRDADLVVLPSHSEGLPRAVLEAQAMGRPVIATEVGGTSETLIDGVTGLLVPPRNGEELAKAIEAVILNNCLPAGLDARARNFVASEYSLDRLAASHEKFYSQATSGLPQE